MTSAYKSMFPRACAATYLDTAAEGLPFPGCREALLTYFDDKSRGTPGRERFHEEEHAAIASAARLLGTEAANVALLASASDALNVFANSIEWRRGDEVVVSDLEFPSGVLAWLRLRERGVRVRVLESSGGAVTLDRFAAAIGPATRVVCASHVSYKTGMRMPFVRELSEAAHAHGALLALDATQSLGRIPVPLEGVDILVASTYKWLLGVHGLGVVYLAPPARERIGDGAVGWYSVRDLFAPDRFERYERKPGAGWMMAGMPGFPSMYALRRAIDFLLECGVTRIEEELRPVVAALREGIARLGYELLTPAEPEYASGIVSFADAGCKQTGAALEREGVTVWAGDGRVRASAHLYNDAADVERFLRVLQAIGREGRACTSRS